MAPLRSSPPKDPPPHSITRALGEGWWVGMGEPLHERPRRIRPSDPRSIPRPDPRRIRTRKIPPRCCFFSEIIMYHGRPCRPAAALLRLVALLGATKSGSSSTVDRSISTSNPGSIGSLVRSVRSEMQDPSWDLWIDKALPCPPGGIRSFRPTRKFISRDRRDQ